MVDNEKIKNLFSWMEEKGITDIEIIDVSKLTPMVDYFMIGTANNEKLCRTAAEFIEEKSKQFNYKILNREGKEEGKWILIDFGDTVLHLFLEKERSRYSLETLWADGEFLKKRNE